MSLRDFNEGDHPGGDREWEDVEEGGEEAGVEEVRESPQQERQQERRQQGRQQQRRQQGRQQQRRQQGRHQQRRQQGRQQESQQQGRQQESQQQSRQQQDKQQQRRQEGQHEGTGRLIPPGRDNDDGARSLDARVAPLRSLNDRAFLDIIRIVELHRLRIFRQCDQFFLPCPRILELATVFPPRNIFDFLAVTRSRQDGGPSEDEPEQGSPVSARHGSSLYSTLFWEGPEALAGIPSCDNSVINPRGVVYFRCLILDILVFIIRRYGAAAILEQFRHWVGEHAQGSAVTLEEDLRTTIGSISLLTNVLETDMNRPNSVNRDCTGMGTSGREPQSTGTGTIGRESRFMGTGASGSVSQSLGTGTSENLEGSNRTDTNSGGPIVPTSCNVHTRNLQMSIVIYLHGVLALFVQYYNAWSQLQGILEAWRNRLETSSTAVRGRGSRSRPRNRRHNQHEPCSIS